MAQHGYLHDTYDRDDFGRGHDDREASWRDRDDDRSWRGRDNDWNDRDRDRGSMFGGWRDQDRHTNERGREDERGFFDRAKNEAEGWFGSDHRSHDRDHYGSDRSPWQDRSRESGSWADRQQQSYGRGGMEAGAFGGAARSGQRYSAHPDDHYRSWRDKQMQALDRDYQDYCREREQQFHSDFDSWRQNRQGPTSQSSMSQGSSGQSQDSGLSASTMELDQPANRGGEIEGATSSPMDAATMGTNNSENDASGTGATGRKR